MTNYLLLHTRLALLALLLLAILSGCRSQETYQIEGQVTTDLTTEGKTVYLSYSSGGVLDSTVVTNGRFRFKGKMPQGEEVIFADLRLYPHYFLPVILEPGYKLQANMESYSTLGSPLNEDLYAFIADIDSVETYYFNQLREVASVDSLNAHRDTLSSSSIEQIYRAMHRAKIQVAKETLAVHTDDVVGLQAFVFILTEADTQQEGKVKELYRQLGPTIQEDSQVKYLLKLRNNQVQTALGNRFVDFEVTKEDGTTLQLSDCVKEGNYVLLLFWTSWSEYNLMFIRELLKLQALYANEPFQIFTVQLASNSKKKVTHAGMSLPWERLVDVNDEAVMSYYQIRKEPTAVLIDPNGYIIARDLQGETLRRKLYELFGYGLQE